MKFIDRSDAGQQLALQLRRYRNQKVVIYAIPRGGVIVAEEIASFLQCPLEIVLAKKITHPDRPEYAIAAISENDHLVDKSEELTQLDKTWFIKEINKLRIDMMQKRQLYMDSYLPVVVEGKIAILVDDGVATGLTLEASILELEDKHPEKIVVAVPVISEDCAETIQNQSDELVALKIVPANERFQSVSQFYEEFESVNDTDVITAINRIRNKKYSSFFHSSYH